MTSRGALYAPGGGLGHLQRAIAVARLFTAPPESLSVERRRFVSAVLEQPPVSVGGCTVVRDGGDGAEQPSNAAWQAPRVTILTTSPFWSLARDSGFAVYPLSGSTAAIEKAVGAWFADVEPDWVVVDTFPAGPTGELDRLRATLPPRRGLVTRRLVGYPVPPAQWPRYDVVGESECAAWHLPGPVARRCTLGPLLVRTREECLSRESARHALGMVDGDDGHVLLACHHGYEGEGEALFRCVAHSFNLLRRQDPRRTAKWVLRLASLRSLRDPELRPYHVAHWPLVELLQGVSALVTAGGYHSVHEAAMIGIPTMHIPMERRFDDQRSRVAHAMRHAGDRPCLAVEPGTATEVVATHGAPPRFYEGLRQLLELTRPR